MAKVTELKDVAVPTRDGNVLRADAYVPGNADASGDGNFPALLLRTPYDKNRERYNESGHRFAEMGYAVVVQDVRGRHASDGEFRPGFYSADHDDSEDGYDSVEWVAEQPWCDGGVGTFGASYDGWTQWELAHARPPHLKAMIPSAIAANLLDRELSGVLRVGRVLTWTVSNLSVDAARRAGLPYYPDSLDEANRLWEERDRSKWLWHLPLREIPDECMPNMGEHWRRWLDDHTQDHFDFEARHQIIDVPVLNITGWYDQQIGTIKHFTGMKENAPSEHTRANQHLIIGPWTHMLTDMVRKVGDVDFGPEAVRDYYEIADQWYGRWLKGRDTAANEWPPIQLFTMGANSWRGESEWPLARTRFTEFYLHSGGKANTAGGDGTLSQVSPAQEPVDAYIYDPRDPVMTLYTPDGQQEPLDQRCLDGRRDVLCYSTPPLEEPLEVTGPITAKLWVASSATDTDFVAKLQDVREDGFTQELCHGIVRARYRDSYDHPSLLTPGQVYELTIAMNPTSNLFRRGHRIRLDITSSDFPNFDRNHNTGGNDYAESTLVTAQQTLFHDAERPSHVVLPVIAS